jgi:hypothetical protein|nr:MAG TPA: hypothetical protein [Bacteriophage sp.]
MFKIGITGQFLNQLQMRWNRKIPEKKSQKSGTNSGLRLFIFVHFV